MQATPILSNWGLPALPIICNTSVTGKSTYLPSFPSKNSVPFTMTSRAGKFTPQARVEVHTKTWIAPLSKRFSTTLRSDSSRPPWCTPTPKGRQCRSAGSWHVFAIESRSSAVPTQELVSSSCAANAIKSKAVRRVCLLEATKIKAGRPDLCGNQPVCRVHFSAMTRPCWLRRAVRNRHRHAVQQASR